MLKEIGKVMQPGDLEYMGSIALHFYRTPDTGLNQGKFEVANISQFAISDMKENVALMGMANLTIELRKYYGHGHATRDTNDKRGNA